MSGKDMRKSASFNSADYIADLNPTMEEIRYPLIKANSDSFLMLKALPNLDTKQSISYPTNLHSVAPLINPFNADKRDENSDDYDDEVDSEEDEIIDMINEEDAEFQFRKVGERRARGVVDENAAAIFRNLATRFGEIHQEIVIKNILRTSYLAERKPRTYDHSKTKAPELPKTPPPVKIRRPVYQPINHNRLLKKILKIKPAIGRVKNESAMSIRSATPRNEFKKGPYYQEPFEPASPPAHLPPALSGEIDIDDCFLLLEDVDTYPPKDHILDNDEFLHMARYHHHPSLLYQPKIENPQPIPKLINNRFKISQVTHELEKKIEMDAINGMYSEPVIPATRREVVGLSNSHVMSAINPYFVNHFSSLDSQPEDAYNNLKTRSNTKVFKSANPLVSNISIADPEKILPVKLPPLKLHTENSLISVLGGVHSRSSKINAIQTKFRSLLRRQDKDKK